MHTICAVELKKPVGAGLNTTLGMDITVWQETVCRGIGSRCCSGCAMAKKGIIVVMLVALAAAAWLAVGASASADHARLQYIYNSYSINGYRIAPVGIVVLNSLERDLADFRNEVASRGQSAERSAMLLALDSKIAVVRMQKNILLGSDALYEVNDLNPGCGAAGDVANAKGYYEEAEKNANEAIQKRNQLLLSYPPQAAGLGIASNEEFEASIEVELVHLGSAKERLGLYCCVNFIEGQAIGCA